MHLAIVIPVYNEEKVISEVINNLPQKIAGIKKISVLVVDDGSSDKSAQRIASTNVILLEHVVNLGYGAASITGLEGAKLLKADLAVTFDGDGQHNPKDIERLIKPILKGKADIVIGTRFKNSKNIPYSKRFGIRVLNYITYFLSGHLASDSQCGLKAFSQKALCFLKLEAIGMEFASEIILEGSKRQLTIVEIPTKIIYTSYSKSKGQSILNGINIVTKLILRKLTH